MVEIIKILMDATNDIHDAIIKSSQLSQFNDKQLHFILIGIIGMIIFAATHILFKWLSKHSITAISFIYTMTVLIVIVFVIEIEQKLTGRGNMEFDDILAGLYGFLYLFAIYLFIRLCVYLIKTLINNKVGKKKVDKI
ncbi:MAG: hypothetical protein GX895_01865 [Clostridiales bacterium]|uniref:hypothetical protein n=1 Tax=Clostridium sp. N3C TaxID=1776758 RepID=UPI00092E1A61|nr:hypothetical protein [Clostridium sp. N3C]NLZ47528.1 hypothetical protein [Clostridiales bacterium]SCN25719.1 hypothetical protein N3C_2452 [Clostridium sp. N3C]